jgi:predicted RNase H-like HicB family nuclease
VFLVWLFLWYDLGMQVTYNIIIEKSEDGYYAECLSLQGAYAQGDSEKEVLENIKDVIQLTLEDMKARNEKIIPVTAFPQISFSALSFTI